MIPPRHQPTSCTGSPPASSETARIARRAARPRPSARARGRGRRRRSRRSRRGRSGARARGGARPSSSRGAGRSRASARRAAGRAARGARGARLVAGDEVAVDRALRRLVDDRAPASRRRSASAAAEDAGRRRWPRRRADGLRAWEIGIGHRRARQSWRSGGRARARREVQQQRRRSASGASTCGQCPQPVEQLVRVSGQRVEDALARPRAGPSGRGRPRPAGPGTRDRRSRRERVVQLGQQPAAGVEVARRPRRAVARGGAVNAATTSARRARGRAKASAR